MKINNITLFLMWLHRCLGHKTYRFENWVTFCITCHNRRCDRYFDRYNQEQNKKGREMTKLNREVIIEINQSDECYDLIDTASDQSHDGDGAKELVAKVYEYDAAVKIRTFLNFKGQTQKEVQNDKTT